MKSLRKKIKDENYIDFGQWLYEIREERGYTEEELVEKIDRASVNVKNIKKWERDLEFPDLESIYKLSEIYMIPSAEIIERKNQTLQVGVEGVNLFVLRMISFIFGIPIYGAIAFYYISYVILFIVLILVFIWFCNI